MGPELVNLLALPVGLGLLGFVDPCSVGASLLFLHYVEGKDAAAKVSQAVVFMLTRAAVIGALGAVAAFVGAAFIGYQKAGWVLLGTLCVVLGLVYLSGNAGRLMRALGPNLGRLHGVRGTVALAVLFALNIPACAAPLLLAVLGTAAASGTSGSARVAMGFVSLGLFGLALSLPLALAMLWAPARRVLDRASVLSRRVPVAIGGLLVVLGAWSIYFGLFVPVGSGGGGS